MWSEYQRLPFTLLPSPKHGSLKGQEPITGQGVALYSIGKQHVGLSLG